MVGWGRVIGAAVLAVVGVLAAALPAIAQQTRRPPTIIIYGDASRDGLADVKRFAALLDMRDKPVIVRGAAAMAIPDNATLVWFGDLAHDPAELKGVPEALREIAEELGTGIPDRPVQLAPGEIRIGANCFSASTPIAVSATATKPIFDIRVGDTVLAFDPEADQGRGALVPRKVVRLFRNATDEWVRVTWEEDGGRIPPAVRQVEEKKAA